jgi:hypothetical protein
MCIILKIQETAVCAKMSVILSGMIAMQLGRIIYPSVMTNQAAQGIGALQTLLIFITISGFVEMLQMKKIAFTLLATGLKKLITAWQLMML